MANDRDDLNQAHRFLGDIKPEPSARDQKAGGDGREEDEGTEQVNQDDANRRAGSRDVDEGGGVASEVGGTRNYHHSGGATGGDLGNRPE